MTDRQVIFIEVMFSSTLPPIQSVCKQRFISPYVIVRRISFISIVFLAEFSNINILIP